MTFCSNTNDINPLFSIAKKSQNYVFSVTSACSNEIWEMLWTVSPSECCPEKNIKINGLFWGQCTECSEDISVARVQNQMTLIDIGHLSTKQGSKLQSLSEKMQKKQSVWEIRWRRPIQGWAGSKHALWKQKLLPVLLCHCTSVPGSAWIINLK